MLRDSGEAAGFYVEQIEELFESLNAELPCPPFESANWPPDAISWFKDSSQSLISSFRDMIAILEIHGRPVRMITTMDPGRILYEDEVQVVAESASY